MKAKLIKTVTDNYILADTTKEFHGEGYLLGATTVSDAPKLSKQNCDELFGVVDVKEVIAKNMLDHNIVDKAVNFSNANPENNGAYLAYIAGASEAFKAMELNKDKVFTFEDVRKAFNKGYLMKFNPSDEYTETLTGLVQSLQQPTEIEVTFNLDEKDSEGCLILKKI